MPLNKEDKIICLYGLYKDNHIHTEEESYFVISYHSLNMIINGKQGFFNLVWKEPLGYWVIFQYVLDEEL